jgi:hypothetical protein
MRPTWRTALILCTGAILTGKIQAAEAGRTKAAIAASWSAEQRAAVRWDIAKRAERVAEHQQRRAQQRRLAPAESRSLPADVIDGSRDPELFFPSQLFEILVRSSFVTLPRAYPHVVAQRTSDLFRQPKEWEQFASAVSDYAALLRNERLAADRLDRSAVVSLEQTKCRAAAKALSDVRSLFGRERFDLMLYEVVPPTMVETYTSDTDFETVVTNAMRRERGCD